MVSLGEASKGRENNFDFLRFLFAAFVLFYHCFPLLLGNAGQPNGLLMRLAPRAAESGVDGFFIISGFLVTASYLRSRTFGRYLRKRVLRIYPAFIAASFFCAFLIGPLGSASPADYWTHFHWVKFLRYLPLLPADVVGPDMALMFRRLPYPSVIDGSFWTLRYEFALYLLTAALGSLGLLRHKWGRGAVLTVFILLFAVYAVSRLASPALLPNREIPWLGSPLKWLRLVPCFLAGMLFYLWRDRVSLSSSLFGPALLLIFLCGLPSPWFSVALPTVGAYLLFAFAFHPSLKLHRFARYGDFSYGLYLYAFPIQQTLTQYFGPHLTPFRLFLAAFPLTLLCAVLSWHLIEKPCLAWKSRSKSPSPQ